MKVNFSGSNIKVSKAMYNLVFFTNLLDAWAGLWRDYES